MFELINVEARKSQEEPGGARRSQEEPGAARRSQEGPEEPGGVRGARRGQEEPGSSGISLVCADGLWAGSRQIPLSAACT